MKKYYKCAGGYLNKLCSWKIFKFMRNTLLLIFITVLQAYANDSYSQNTKLTLNLNNVTVANVLEEIQNNSEFYFLFNAKLIDVEREVSVSMEDKTISEILNYLFSGTGVNYLVFDRQIILTPSDVKPLSSEIQQQKISGTITDESGNPLPGVNIQIEGTTSGTNSDASGRYSIDRPNENAILIFSFIGYNTQKVPASGKTIIDIKMVPNITGLEEVVVTGYGVQKMVNLTGSVTKVNSDRLEKRPVSNINQALQGVAPGLNIVPDSKYGGEPGASMDFNIRGIGSLSGGTPYVLVDGMPVDMNSVNPDDVESISILKDAAACAIYGARAAYGVILITTKSGSLNKKVEMSYSNTFSWAEPLGLPGYVNSLTFANSMNEAGLNSGQNKLFSDETIQRIKDYQADPEHFPSMIPDPNDPNGWGYWNLANGNTNWYDVYFKDWSFSQKHNLSITGGSEKSSYYLGLGWLDEGGKFNFAHDNYQRFNVTLNNSFKVTDWLTLSLKSKFDRSYINYPKSSESTDRTVMFWMIGHNWPNYPVYTPNGDMAMDLNQTPALAHGGSDEQYISDLWIAPAIEIKVTNNWKITADFNYNYNGYKRSNFTAILWGLAPDGVTPVKHYAQNYNSISQELTNNDYYSTNVYSTYEKNLNGHYFSFLIGGQAELSNNMLLNGWRRDLVSEAVPAISTATGDKSVDDAISHWSTLGTFMRISYNFKEKYLLELNGRYDGTSRFQEEYRWGFFPSVSVGYNIWKEDFWVPVKNVVNTLKLRASYGSLGNQNVPNYLQVEILPINTNLPWIMDGIRPVYTTTPSNPSLGLTWEKANTINFGLDAGFLNNRLNVIFDWFDRKTEDMFGPGEALPAVLGTSVPLQNNATLDTKGVELAVSWKQAVNADFSYGLSLTFSDSKSIVTKYNNPTKYIYNFYEGQNYGDIWGYESEGFFKSDQEAQAADQSQLYSKWTAGDIKYKDLNHDEKITRGDETVANPGDLKIIGNTTPRYLIGINVNASYKGFDFDMFWQGVGKKDVWMDNPVYWGFMEAFWASGLQTHSLDYWSSNNTDAYFPKPYLTPENFKNHAIQTRYLQNAAYMRLKNIQLGYSLPSSITRKIKIERLRVYLSGENVLTFSHILKPFDPEANAGLSEWGQQYSGLVYPLSRVFGVGLNVTF
jgi:TonB-linked SusC/RagA family outer membrane protein